ncbi:hypothetical protein [Parvibaculum sp.]|uniref:hypothetical protein n=1 Tax=Parvibaculum sp. TaxID=2024848 RepID=UPI002BAC6482|nr:hypothetical protein [Parvibaculum sp.]HUD52889.1 hypothetical protein [Parvibaculum sp.]
MTCEIIKAEAVRAVEAFAKVALALRGGTLDGQCTLGCPGCDGKAYCQLRKAMMAPRDLC